MMGVKKYNSTERGISDIKKLQVLEKMLKHVLYKRVNRFRRFLCGKNEKRHVAGGFRRFHKNIAARPPSVRSTPFVKVQFSTSIV